MCSKKKSNILDVLKKRNINRFGIFFGIAFIFLIFSKLSSDYNQLIKLKIQFTDLAEEIIIKEDTSNVIETVVEAKGFALVPFIFNNTETILLNANEDVITNADELVFEVQKNSYLLEEQLGSSYKIRSLKPEILHIPYSKRASKSVPVKLNSNIKYATGYDLYGNFNLSKDSVKIVGPIDKITDITYVTTNELKLVEVNTNIKTSVTFNKIEDVEVFPKSINVEADVKRFTEGKIEVPLTIINKPENVLINYFPKTVTLSYYVDLESFNSITPSEFSVECDYSLINSNQTYFVPKIAKMPEFIKRVNIKQKRIDFIRL
ncbi:MAG: hypothetical protein CMC05_14275 [Flavobacteriaceae bacterium]|nr:hypothetical protein [Flavobacteriaceae bacterium]MBD09239.1 hypothetical protein [Flavobacteriaceae bacterium]|tara:strand:+ start:6177 stop:7133 length:957 start_codon:yes stop_codon:yes gene_type:complete